MTYNDVLKYLDDLYGMLGYDLGLERMEKLMEEMGNPQDKLKVIHVAGTNGKGSVCSFISNVLRAQGYKVGVYTSPHLEKYNERFVINGEEISDEKFVEHMAYAKQMCDKIVAKGVGQPTVFEVVTAAAFNYFAQENVDYLVLEVGLGGRCDATNVVKKPLLSVIVSISMDHMEYLGSTLSDIAYEKGGIIKEECPVVLYAKEKEVYDKIKEICTEKNAPLYAFDESNAFVKKEEFSGTEFDFKNNECEFENIKIKLLGDYQIINASQALLSCYALRKQGVEISDKAVKEGMESARWSGRMEIVEENPVVMLDGAHNIDGIHMLAQSLKKYFANKKLTLLIGILGDKEYEKMVETLMPLASKVVFTEPNSSRKWHVDAIGEITSKYNVEIHIEKDIAKAYSLAKSITDKNDAVICAGSLYLIGALYQEARKK